MRSGYKITLSILTIMILVTITIGTSYAFYSVSSEQEGTNTLNTTCFEVSFSDSNSIALNTAGNYAYPMSDDSASSLTPYTFTVKNTCSSGADIKYVATLSTLTSPSSTLDLSLVRYSLGTTSTNGTAATLGGRPTYDLSNVTDTNTAGLDTTYNLIEGTLSPGSEVTYYLRLWIDETADNEVMGDTFTGRLLVYSYM